MKNESTINPCLLPFMHHVNRAVFQCNVRLLEDIFLHIADTEVFDKQLAACLQNAIFPSASKNIQNLKRTKSGTICEAEYSYILSSSLDMIGLNNNRETYGGGGRADMILDETDYAVVFELKITKNRYELNNKVVDALSQIEERGYYKNMSTNKTLYKVGIAIYESTDVESRWEVLVLTERHNRMNNTNSISLQMFVDRYWKECKLSKSYHTLRQELKLTKSSFETLVNFFNNNRSVEITGSILRFGYVQYSVSNDLLEKWHRLKDMHETTVINSMIFDLLLDIIELGAPFTWRNRELAYFVEPMNVCELENIQNKINTSISDNSEKFISLLSNLYCNFRPTGYISFSKNSFITYKDFLYANFDDYIKKQYLKHITDSEDKNKKRQELNNVLSEFLQEADFAAFYSEINSKISNITYSGDNSTN